MVAFPLRWPSNQPWNSQHVHSPMLCHLMHFGMHKDKNTIMSTDTNQRNDRVSGNPFHTTICY